MKSSHPLATSADRAPCNALAQQRPVPVHDPFCVTEDPTMPMLAHALNPAEVHRQFARHLPHLLGEHAKSRLHAIRVIRYKPERRCLIAYDLETANTRRSSYRCTILGKVRARGVDISTYRLHAALRNAGFGDESADGVSVPAPFGVIPAFHMWLQQYVPGISAIRILTGPDGVAFAHRVAEALYKLHRANVPPHRHHSMEDELRILHARLPALTQRYPHWTRRLARVLEACDRLGAAVPSVLSRGIHRDFYPDQVLVSGSRLYLLDFDLYCVGNPGLDVGNFLGHLTEYSLRTWGDPAVLADRETVLEERFVALTGEALRPVVQAYTTLTLVRHIYLSTVFPERRACTEPLLELCEQRLRVGQRPGAGSQTQQTLLQP